MLGRKQLLGIRVSEKDLAHYAEQLGIPKENLQMADMHNLVCLSLLLVGIANGLERAITPSDQQSRAQQQGEPMMERLDNLFSLQGVVLPHTLQARLDTYHLVIGLLGVISGTLLVGSTGVFEPDVFQRAFNVTFEQARSQPDDAMQQKHGGIEQPEEWMGVPPELRNCPGAQTYVQMCKLARQLQEQLSLQSVRPDPWFTEDGEIDTSYELTQRLRQSYNTTELLMRCIRVILEDGFSNEWRKKYIRNKVLVALKAIGLLTDVGFAVNDDEA